MKIKLSYTYDKNGIMELGSSFFSYLFTCSKDSRQAKNFILFYFQDYNGKLADLGFAKDTGATGGKTNVSTRTTGTSYAAPEYLATGNIQHNLRTLPSDFHICHDVINFLPVSIKDP